MHQRHHSHRLRELTERLRPHLHTSHSRFRFRVLQERHGPRWVIGASSLITITLATTIAYIGHLSGGKAFSLSSYVGTVNGFRSRVAGAARRAPVSLASVIPLPISRVEPSPTRETPSRLPAPSVDYLLENLRDSSRTVSWTIPAGLTNTQIALLWQHKGFGTGLEFLSALNDPRLLADFGLAPPMSDGWILAGTVRFAQGSSAGSVVRQLLTTFRDETTALFAEAANRYPNLSQKHILTLASIIEKEAGSLSERRKVSSVFHNRLRRGMRLQAEPTIAYALGHPRRPLRPSDRRAQSAFNTYHVVGLPPSPICNVSYESILAAVTPEKTTHLFFDVGENGSNRYSDSYDEHVVPNVADEDMTRIAQTP